MNGITYKEYYDFLYMNTLLMKYEVQVVARMMWNKGIDKYDAVKIINKSLAEQEDDSYGEEVWNWIAEILESFAVRAQ